MYRFFGVLFLFCILAAAAAGQEKSQVSPTAADPVTGKLPRVHLPAERHLKNKTSPAGQGCCAWASLDMASDVQQFMPMIGILNERRGGAWAGDLDAAFARRAPGFSRYLQATGSATVELMDWALASGRPAWVTYDWDDHYGPRGQSMYHMVILVHLDAAGVPTPRACIIDNNRPGKWVWMSRAEFLRRHAYHRGWAGAYTLPPSPPALQWAKE